MPQTVTAVNACDVSVWLDDDAGVPKNISGSSNTVSMEFTNQLGNVRNFGTRWQIRLECGKDATVNLTAVYSTAADEAWDIIKNWFFNFPGKRTLKIYIPDKNVGSDVYTGEFRLASAPVTVEAGTAEPITVSCQLMPDGPVTLTTNAT